MKKVKVSQKHKKSAKEKAEIRDKAENIRKINKSSLELEKYLKENNLDPHMDWRKDPEHGPTIKKILTEIQNGRAKLSNPLTPKKPNSLPKKDSSVKPVKGVANQYEYPEGLDATQKKRYRSKMRSLLKSHAEIKDANKKALEYALKGPSSKKEESPKVKPDKAKKEKPSVEKKPKKKLLKKTKKSRVEED